jgi:hypothetical protein
LEEQKKESIKNAVLLFELQPEAVKKNIQEIYPTTAKFFAGGFFTIENIDVLL